MNLDELIDSVIQNPTDENKEMYDDYVSRLEYDLIVENKRSEAFTIRGKCAAKMLQKWISVYGSSEGCPASYADTLNRPFLLEKNKYLKKS
jgi:hypothetical protein